MTFIARLWPSATRTAAALLRALQWAVGMVGVSAAGLPAGVQVDPWRWCLKEGQSSLALLAYAWLVFKSSPSKLFISAVRALLEAE